MAKNVRINPATGELDYYFPLEVTDASILEYARVHGLEIGMARLGFRNFKAVFVPCKDKHLNSHGTEVYIETPSDVQHQRYLNLIKDEMSDQEAKKQDGRCNIPDGHGGLKRCPCRVPNPEYVTGGDKPKTIAVRCEGCVYEKFRQAHTTIVLSALDHENESGEFETFEIPASKDLLTADRFLELRQEFIAFVKDRNPKLTPLAELLTLEFTKSEAARELGDAWGTVTSRTDKLKELVTEFLDTIVTP